MENKKQYSASFATCISHYEASSTGHAKWRKFDKTRCGNDSTHDTGQYDIFSVTDLRSLVRPIELDS